MGGGGLPIHSLICGSYFHAIPSSRPVLIIGQHKQGGEGVGAFKMDSWAQDLSHDLDICAELFTRSVLHDACQCNKNKEEGSSRSEIMGKRDVLNLI